MPSSHKETKTYKGAWLERDVIENLKAIAKGLGVDFTAFLKKIANGEFVVEKKKENDK